MSDEPMPPLLGEPSASPLDGAEHVGDIEWHDGPLASIFRDAQGLLYAHWCDQSHEAHRWAVARIRPEHLRSLGDGELSMRSLLTISGGEAWLLDIGTSGDPVPNGCVRVGAFPEEYLPSEDSTAPRVGWFYLDRERLAAACAI